MKKAEDIVALAEELVAPVIAENHFVLVDVEYVKEAGTYYLRYYIDKEGGITIDDCETVSRYVSDKLDATDPIEDNYILEVSSPGLGRPLVKPKDFARNVGKEVEIKLYKPVPVDDSPVEDTAKPKKKSAQKTKDFTGTLVSYDDETVTIALSETKERTFERKEIALIRQALDF
ncbi:MAG: ribosome maturation factor RimP [Lachnospiraceae bacterium]|nr:ribosome maturation factor RimP [Lachnospiraceae bacterium]